MFLVALAVISIFFNTTISYPALILLLVPLPFIFRSQLAQLIALIHMARIKKLGPIEFEQNPPTAEIAAVARLQVQEGIVFWHLNQFFALRTKILLQILAQRNDGLNIADFQTLALSVGVPAENVEITLSAIVQANCAEIRDGRILLTVLGQRYVQEGLRFAQLAQPTPTA